jgi:hypothetical protein
MDETHKRNSGQAKATEYVINYSPDYAAVTPTVADA